MESNKLEDLGKLMRDNNTQLPAEVQKEIADKADEYARTFSGTRTIKRPYISGATEYATKLHQLQGENEALKGNCKTRDAFINLLTSQKTEAWNLLTEVFQKHEADLLPDRFIYEKIKTFLYGE